MLDDEDTDRVPEWVRVSVEVAVFVEVREEVADVVTVMERLPVDDCVAV